MATIGERLVALREHFGMSQAQVANIIGVDRTSYAKYEKDVNKPTRKLKELSELFKVSTDYIMCLSDCPTLSKLEEGDIVLQQSPKCRVLVHTTKGLPDEAMDDLIAIAKVYKKKYGIK